MQTQTQAHSGPNPVATATAELHPDTQTEAQPAQSEPHAQERRSSSPAEIETPQSPQEDEKEVQTTEEHQGVAMTQGEPVVQPLTESSNSTKDLRTDADKNSGSKCDGSGSKTKDQGVRGRKYIPSKKAMVDPLKMDMSMVIPLTSAQLSMQCLECHIIFSDPKSKERHLKMSHPAEYEQCILRNALFACYVCERHFSNSTELMAHQKAHIEKKPFKCLICGLAFKKTSELTLHKKIHFDHDGYRCTDCGKACKTMTLLKYHRRTHTGERPFICKECGKRFAMSKSLQKHELLHVKEGADGEEGITSDTAHEKKDGGGPKNYPCSLCNTTFKSAKTRQRHMKTKHIFPAANRSLPAGLQKEQVTPVITPISISQPTLLQLEASGPLQKVDANIDTEQIRRLIESLGNVQKVNQVVILGQVPPHAPPLEVQQISQGPEGVTLNLNPPQIDFMGLKDPECKTIELNSVNNHCDPMEQTIILEPITPDGQLETVPFSELGSHMVAGENPGLTFDQSEQTQRPEGEGSPQIVQQSDISEFQTDPMEHMICQNEQDLEQTVILELTPALIPTMELEQFQTMPQTVFFPSTEITTTEPEQNPEQTLDEMVINAANTNMLESLPPQKDEYCSPSCLFVPADSLQQTPSEPKTCPKEAESLQMQTGSKDLTHSAKDKAVPQETKENAVQEASEAEPFDQEQSQQNTSKQDRSEETSPENLLLESRKDLEKVGNLSGTVKSSAEEEGQSQQEARKLSQTSELPLNVMSAQELVKVRKRKPARAFYFQGYKQDLAASLYEDFSIYAAPVKRQRTKKSHLVVKFGPQNKDKKNKKQKKTSQQHRVIQEDVLRGKSSAIHLSKKNVTSQKEKKGKRDKKREPAVSAATSKATSSIQEPQSQQHKDDMKRNKKQKGREDLNNVSVTASPVTKKKKMKVIKKDEPKIAKVEKGKKILARKVKETSKTSTASAVQTGQHVTEDSLLLLKGHKQPQLKVYKLDPLKASGSTLEDSPNDVQIVSGQGKDKLKHPSPGSVNYPISEGKKKGGRPQKSQKVLSLLSSKKVSLQPSESPPAKPKTTRKRKPSSKVETEGVITSPHSKRALECQDCGEKFSEVSSLQKHKTTVHVVESPGLTYTNGNIFEGVSRLDLYQLPQQQGKTMGLMNASTGWDTEPEMGEITLEDRERNVSFPALIPSPSLPVPPLDVEIGTYEDKAGCTKESDNHLSSEQIVNSDSLHIQSEPPFSASPLTHSSVTGDPTSSDMHKHGEHTLKKTETEVQSSLDEDIKEDLLMEVDLVTVGEQNERDNPASLEDKTYQNELFESSKGGRTDKLPEQVTEDIADNTSQTVSCSTHQEEIKEEEEEIGVRKEKEDNDNVMRGSAKGVGRGTGRLKRNMVSGTLSAEATLTWSGSGQEQNECQVVYENHLITSDREETEDGTSTKITEDKNAVTSARSEEPPEKIVSFEAASNTTGVEKVMEYDRDKSPVVILERVITSTPKANADTELCQKLEVNNKKQGFNSSAQKEVQVLGSQEIKVEEVISDPTQAGPACQNRPSANMQSQHHCAVRTVLVKEECSLVLNEAQTSQGSSIFWNVEPIHVDTSSAVINSGETTRHCHNTPEFNSTQCIFYPVKEEEREVLVGAAPSSRENLFVASSSNAGQPEHQAKDNNLNGGSPSLADYQEKSLRRLSSEKVDSNFAEGNAETDTENQHPPDVRDFLLQSSDEEDVGCFELSDPQLDSEAEIMAYFHKNNDSQRTDEAIENSPHSEIHFQPPREEMRTKKPVDYFSTYFGWDTWVEIASCTNKLSNISNPVTAREVAQFVGIHIAMGTLKFPSPRLYWDDLTKVPLISDAMPLSRFLELCRTLKLANPAKNLAESSAQIRSQDINSQPRKEKISTPSDEQRERHTPVDLNNSGAQIDPLWKAKPLFCRFKAGCQSLRRDSNYAVDQYLLPLTGKTHSKKLSLHCTKLIGFGGLLLHVDFKMGLSGKEDAVEKMVPRGSMVFLCRQELSTPAMLERLLIAGVHGAGRVGGARGQIGDEFVSSDGKLMLRRSHCGFILSTAGNGQRNMALLTDNFEKAQMSAHLNRNLVNLYSIPLTASAPTCWPQAILWYLTDLALVNSWLLYRRDHKAESTSLSFMAFRLEVSKSFIQTSSSDTQDSVPSHSPLEKAHAAHESPNPSLVEESPLPDAATRYDGSGHWPEQLAEGEGGRCRFGGCQRTTRVLCLKCCVFLCISRNHNCFLNFHSQGSLRKK